VLDVVEIYQGIRDFLLLLSFIFFTVIVTCIFLPVGGE